MTSDALRVMGEVVPFDRGQAGVAHADETRAIALKLYATGGGRSPAAVEKLLPSYLEPMGLPVPSRQTIATWAREDDWNTRADDLWRAHPDMGVLEMKRLTVATLLVLAKQMHDMVTGLDNSPLEERMLKTKQYEIGFRIAERIPQLATYNPPEPAADTTQMPREEREARARQALVRRK